MKPPVLTLAVVWHPEPLQSSVPIGMWFADVVVIVMLANVPATVDPWQFEAGGHALVGAGDGILRVVIRVRMTLRARRRGRDVIGGLCPVVTFVVKVGVVVWQPPQSPVVGWLLSKAVGRESPGALSRSSRAFP